jgi:DSF synthase
MSNLNDAIGLRTSYGDPQSQFTTEYDEAAATVWGYMNPRGTPCFSLGLLKDIRAHDLALEQNGGCVEIDGTWKQVRYYVGASRSRGVYNLGGDLSLFMLLIKSQDRDALASYARMCLDNLYPRIVNYNCSRLTTISLVQGDALGGGFECALTSDVIVAEESAQLGLPEIMFNLFPGMGAYNLLARRAGPRVAEEVILAGRLFSAAKLREMGVIDVVAKDGQGESAVQEWIAANARRCNGMQGVFRARDIAHPITRAQLDAIADIWVEAALRLEERDLKMMNWLVRAQQRRMHDSETTQHAAMPLAVASGA